MTAPTGTRTTAPAPGATGPATPTEWVLSASLLVAPLLYLAADTTFHLHLLSLTGNDRLVTLVGDLRQQTRLVGLATMLGSPELTSSSQEHLTLLDLLEAGDGAAAEELMRRHLGHVTGWWSGRAER